MYVLPSGQVTNLAIATHYHCALTKTFAAYEYAVFIEDDLKIAEDFFQLMLAGKHLIENYDRTGVWCASGWWVVFGHR